MIRTENPAEIPEVLVVDDDHLIRCAIRETLEEFGFRVREAENGRVALEKAGESRPDVVLLDVLMPELDGFSTCVELRRVFGEAHVPVVMVTALEDTRSILRAYDCGATDFITKPINRLVLGHRVRYILRASRAFEALRQSRASLATAQRLARLGNWQWDIAADRMDWSDEVCEIFGLSAERCAASYDAFLQKVHPEDRATVERGMAETLEKGTPFRLDFRVLGPDGGEHFVHGQAEVGFDREGRPVRLCGTFQDVSERKRAEQQIRFLAYYDSLTGLPNRALFNERLQFALTHARRNQRKAALLFLDLDRFKVINDTLGHSVGDMLLCGVADRLLSTLRETDFVARPGEPGAIKTVARLGGDEFTILLSDLENVQDVIKIARRILTAIDMPFHLAGQEVFVTGSIGLALYPADGEDLETLVKHADTAMYHAKEQGRNNYQFFSESMNATAVEMLALENRLRKAVERRELVLHYQPQLDLRTGLLCGVEALVRWAPDGGKLLPPSEFLPLAEETGLILEIGEWVVRRACSQARAWLEMGIAPLRMSVNLSSRQFWQQPLVEVVTAALAEAGLDPRWLVLEITESVLLQHNAETLAALRALKELGVGVAIDDFGTGYSSLSYLKRFPLDILKIDQSFVRDIEEGRSDPVIISAIIAMARSLGLRTVAEGVETARQLEFLREEGCEEVQGFLLSPPLSAEEIVDYLRNPRLP